VNPKKVSSLTPHPLHNRKVEDLEIDHINNSLLSASHVAVPSDDFNPVLYRYVMVNEAKCIFLYFRIQLSSKRCTIIVFIYAELFKIDFFGIKFAIQIGS
jgi:hypothetical protein